MHFVFAVSVAVSILRGSLFAVSVAMSIWRGSHNKCCCTCGSECCSRGCRSVAVSDVLSVAMSLVKKAEIRQPWVVNGHNAHTPDSREACQAIAFYDNFTSEKSRPIKIEPLSIT